MEVVALQKKPRIELCSRKRIALGNVRSPSKPGLLEKPGSVTNFSLEVQHDEGMFSAGTFGTVLLQDPLQTF